MIPSRLPARLHAFSLPKLVGGLAALILLSVVPLCIAQSPAVSKNGEPVSPPPAANHQAAPITPKQEAPKKSNGEKAKADAAELSTLADQLRDQLNKMNVNILSFDVIQKTEAIEKLAKKIKGEANEH
jgi:hypothetical protein